MATHLGEGNHWIKNRETPFKNWYRLYTHTHTHTHPHTHPHTLIHTYIHTHTQTHTHTYIYIYIWGLDKIMETPGNFKQISFNMVFWLQPSRKIRLCAVPILQFWGNWVFEMVIKLCCNFQTCILVILHNNHRKSPTVPIWQLSLSSLQWGSFSFFIQMLPLLSRQ